MWSYNHAKFHVDWWSLSLYYWDIVEKKMEEQNNFDTI